MQNVHIISRTKFNVISNGAIAFAASLDNIMCWKMDKTIHRNCACIQPAFSAFGLNLQETPMHHSK
jgi:hypothetical protein